jgi:hypothetical protein
MNSRLLIAISFLLVLAGFLVPFLIVLQVLEPGLMLSFSAYVSSLVGLVLGLYGAFHFSGSRRGDDQ